VTILGRGDLSPPRRSRSRQGRRGPVLALLLVLALLAVGGWFGWRTMRGSAKAARPPRTCVTPTPSASPPAAAGFVLTVLNSTDRQGLAHQIATALHGRGFRIGHVGNTTPAVAGSAQVVYGTGLQAAALTVAEQVPGATPTASTRPGIALVIGTGFKGLAAPAAAAAARAHDLTAASPRPPVCTGS
jgi:hypothetical protein